MNRKWLPYIIIIALGVILFAVRYYDNSQTKSDTTTTSKEDKSPAAKVNRNRGFDRRISYIEYTRHADCRMDCRKISKKEVEEIMRDGVINYNKSNLRAHPCPEYAVEGVTSDEQRVRIIFAQCDQKTRVVTTIDLDTDWSCSCPGDDKKHQPKK